jgi:hypothetical protein
MPAPKGNKYGKGNKGGDGRPTKYDPKFLKQVQRACQAGLTDTEIAEMLGVSVRVIYDWKKDHEEFSAALKIGKAPADDRVERAAFEMAVGCYRPVMKAFVYQGEILTQEVMEYFPPNPTSNIFWLKNRRPDEWREKQFAELAANYALSPELQAAWDALQEDVRERQRLIEMKTIEHQPKDDEK